jgi:hypothetical protein
MLDSERGEMRVCDARAAGLSREEQLPEDLPVLFAGSTITAGSPLPRSFNLRDQFGNPVIVQVGA